MVAILWLELSLPTIPAIATIADCIGFVQFKLFTSEEEPSIGNPPQSKLPSP